MISFLSRLNSDGLEFPSVKNRSFEIPLFYSAPTLRIRAVTAFHESPVDHKKPEQSTVSICFVNHYAN